MCVTLGGITNDCDNVISPHPPKYRYTYKSGINQGKQTDNNLMNDKIF